MQAFQARNDGSYHIDAGWNVGSQRTVFLSDMEEAHTRIRIITFTTWNFDGKLLDSGTTIVEQRIEHSYRYWGARVGDLRSEMNECGRFRSIVQIFMQ